MPPIEGKRYTGKPQQSEKDLNFGDARKKSDKKFRLRYQAFAKDFKHSDRSGLDLFPLDIPEHEEGLNHMTDAFLLAWGPHFWPSNSDSEYHNHLHYLEDSDKIRSRLHSLFEHHIRYENRIRRNKPVKKAGKRKPTIKTKAKIKSKRRGKARDNPADLEGMASQSTSSNTNSTHPSTESEPHYTNSTLGVRAGEAQDNSLEGTAGPSKQTSKAPSGASQGAKEPPSTSAPSVTSPPLLRHKPKGGSAAGRMPGHGPTPREKVLRRTTPFYTPRSRQRNPRRESQTTDYGPTIEPQLNTVEENSNNNSISNSSVGTDMDDTPNTTSQDSNPRGQKRPHESEQLSSSERNPSQGHGGGTEGSSGNAQPPPEKRRMVTLPYPQRLDLNQGATNTLEMEVVETRPSGRSIGEGTQRYLANPPLHCALNEVPDQSNPRPPALMHIDGSQNSQVNEQAHSSSEAGHESNHQAQAPNPSSQTGQDPAPGTDSNHTDQGGNTRIRPESSTASPQQRPSQAGSSSEARESTQHINRTARPEANRSQTSEGEANTGRTQRPTSQSSQQTSNDQSPSRTRREREDNQSRRERSSSLGNRPPTAGRDRSRIVQTPGNERTPTGQSTLQASPTATLYQSRTRANQSAESGGPQDSQTTSQATRAEIPSRSPLNANYGAEEAQVQLQKTTEPRSSTTTNSVTNNRPRIEFRFKVMRPDGPFIRPEYLSIITSELFETLSDMEAALPPDFRELDLWFLCESPIRSGLIGPNRDVERGHICAYALWKFWMNNHIRKVISILPDEPCLSFVVEIWNANVLLD